MTGRASSGCRGRLPDVASIAVLRPNQIGDLMFALPALAALRETYPAARIVYLGRQWHKDFLERRTPLVDGPALYLGTRGEESANDHRAHALALDRATGKVLWRYPFPAADPKVNHGFAAGAALAGDRLPGTFDQDVYVELMRRFHEAGAPADGGVSFTLHAFLRSMGRQVDGRTYEQLRSSLTRLERTMLQSERCYFDAATADVSDVSFTLLSSVNIERRRSSERDQLALFPAVIAAEPGEARVVISPVGAKAPVAGS